MFAENSLLLDLQLDHQTMFVGSKNNIQNYCEKTHCYYNIIGYDLISQEMD